MTGARTAITGIEPYLRRADTGALACVFRISAEAFVAEFAADLVGAVTVLFAADLAGAFVCF